MGKSWQSQSERGNRTSLWLFRAIAIHLGRRVARALLLPITGYYLLTAKDHRRASRHYLRRALNRDPGWLDVARHIHCFASTILDRVYFVTDRVDNFHIEFVGDELVEKLREKKCGCLMVGAHIGSFEALRVLGIRYQHLPLKVLMYPDQSALITRLIGELNPDIAESIIPLGGIDSLVRVRESLEHGGMVGILADRIAENKRTAKLVLLGSEAMFPLGPAILAETLNATVVLCLALFLGGNKYRILFEELPPVETGNRAQRTDRAREWTKAYVNRLEYHLNSAPYNWFNFYDFWSDEKNQQ